MQGIKTLKIKQLTLIAGFICLMISNTGHAATRYWVGGSGDWSDANHWSTVSGILLLPGVPAATDDVVFDAASAPGAYVVTSAVPVTVSDFTATNSDPCNWNLSITITGNFLGANAASVLGSGTHTFTMNAGTGVATFDANGTTFNANMFFNKTGANSVNFTGGFTNVKDVDLVNGILNFNAHTYTASTLISIKPTTDVRAFDFDNANFVITGALWRLDSLGGNRPNSVHSNSAGVFTLRDVSGTTPVYNDVEVDGQKLVIIDTLQLDLLDIASDTLELQSGIVLRYNTINSFVTCPNPMIVRSVAAPFASMHYVGVNDTSYVGNIHFVDVSARDSVAIKYYGLPIEVETAAKGWIIGKPAAYYWIGNAGDWSDPAHWSLSSGGPQSCAFPADSSVFVFDANSFSLPNQTVNFDTAMTVKGMTWATIDQNATFFLEKDVKAIGNVTLNSMMLVTRDTIARKIQFNAKAHFNPAGSEFDCNLSINTPATDTLHLDGNLLASDSSNIYHLAGRFMANSHNIEAQTYIAILATPKVMNLGSSNIYLRDGWNSDTLQTPELTVVKGTSDIEIGRSTKSNFFISRNQSYNNVTFNFNPKRKGIVRGTNTITELTITPGSWIEFTSGNTTTFDSLHINGGCNRFVVDTIQLPLTDIDTISIDTISVITTIYNDTTLSNVFGFAPIPRDTVYDTLFVYNQYLSDSTGVDTVITMKVISRAHIIDTIIGSPNQYVYSDSLTEYVIHAFIEIDTIGWAPGYVYGEDSDTLTGRQQVYLHSSVSGNDFNFSSTKVQEVYGVKVRDGNFSGGGTLTAYFSIDSIGNNGWVFNTSPTSVPSFTAGPSFCFGDTTHFTNNTTSYSGDTDDLIYVWDYSESITLGDTNAYVFENSGQPIVTLTSYYTNGCKEVYTDSILIHNPTVFFNMNQPDERICAGTPVEFSASAINDSMTQYQFYNNGISLGAMSLVDSIIVNNLANGDSVAVVASLFGCYAEDTLFYNFQVDTLPTVVLASSDANDSICAGTSVTFTSSGAVNYQYFINGGSVTGSSSTTTYTTATLANTNTVYSVGIVPATQCRDTSAIRTFGVLPLPATTLNSSIAASAICAGDNVTFTAAGASTYEFFINNTSQGAPSATTTFSTSGLTSGQVVKVVGYSALGCPKEAPTTFSYNVIPLPVATLAADDADLSVCGGDNVTFTAGGGATYEFFINGVSQGAPSGTSFFNTTSLADNDIVNVEASFSGCNAFGTAITMDVRTNPTTALASSDANDTICQTALVTFTGSGATNYTFLLNSGTVQAASADNTYDNATLSSGDVITLVGESNNCIVTDEITITVLGLPNINILSSDADNTVCNGTAITFTGTGGNAYQLVVDGTPGASQASPTFVSTLGVGSHSVGIMGTGLNGCPNISNNILNVVVNAIPSPSVASNDADNTICAGTPVTFTASGAANYQFFVNGISQTGSTPVTTYSTNSLTTGQTIYVVGSTLGCTAPSSAITMTVNPIPVVGMSTSDVDNVYCQGTSVTYTAAGATNYEFFLDGVSQGAPSATNTFNTSAVASGAHQVLVQGTSLGCSASTSQNIQINSNPVAGLTSSDANNVICSGDLITFNATGGSVYEFFVNAASQGSGPLASYTTSSLPGGASVNVVVTNSAGCVATSGSIVTIVNTTPNAALSSSDADNSICSGTSITFTGSGASTYEFFLDGVSQGAPSATTTYTSSTLTNNANIYVVGYASGCQDNSNSIATTVIGFPSISLTSNGSTALCSTDSPNVIANGATTYEFFLDGVSQGAPSTNNIFTLPVSNNDVLSVIGYTSGCQSNGANTISFTVTPTPTVNLSSSDADLNICYGQSITFTGTGASNYEFSVNNIPMQNGASGSFITSELEDGSIVSLIGSNNQCTSNNPQLTFVVNTMDLTLTANPSEIACTGDNLTFTASGADQYEFFYNGASQGPSSITSTFSPTTLVDGDAIYFIGHNITTGCDQNLGYIYFPNVIDASVITVDGATPFCFGDSVVLTSSHEYGNQWLMDGNPMIGEDGVSLTVFNDGLYSLEHTAGGNNQVWSKGYNGSGTFGNGANIDSSVIQSALGMTDITQMSSGYDYVIALTQAGTVYAWGENGSGQLGNGTFTTTNAPIQVPTLANITQVATTSSSSAALTAGGQLYVWGNNNHGQLGIGSTSVVNFPFLIPTVTNVSEIAGGKDHFVIRKTDGTVWTVGYNSQGQLGNGTLNNASTFIQVAALSNIAHVGSGENSSFAINNNGDLYVWGANINGQLGLGDQLNRLTPTLSTIKHISAATGGATHSVFTTELKEIYVSGDNAMGQLGTSTVTSTVYPIKLTIGGVEKVSAGEYSTLLLLADARVLGTGYNAEEQLFANTGNIMDFTEIEDVDGVRVIESGKRTSHFVFGGATTCSNASVDIVVNTPIAPTLTENGFDLSSNTAVGYQWFRDNQLIPSATNQNYTVFATGWYYVQITDANGCNANSDTVYLEVVGLDEVAADFVKMYPNPTSGNVTIEFTSDNAVCEVRDAQGKLIFTEELMSGESIDLQSLATGVYLFTLKTELGITTRRVVKH